MALDEGKRRPSKSIRRAETKARYQDVVRAAQQQIAQDYADDPVAGRIPARPGGSRNKGIDDYAAAPVGLALFGDPNLKRGFTDTRDFARTAIDTLTSPDASRREKIEAAGGVGAVGGALGWLPGRKPKLPAAEKAARPAGADDIVEALPEARKLRRQQEAGYSAERGKRIAKAKSAMDIGGEAGYRAALAELKGELPKLKMGDDLKDFDQKAADELFTHIQQAEGFRPFERIRGQTALRKVLDGQVPTKSEIKLLERAFGPDLAQQVAETVSWWRKAKNVGLSIINVPRSLQASVDLSAPFRQGLVLGAAQPKMFAREFGPMLKAFAREGAYEDTMGAIAEMPNFTRMQKGKLAITDLEGSAASREDYFNSAVAERIPGVGRLVRASGRAYTAFLNKFRADAFNHYLRMAEDAGIDVDDEMFLKSLGTFINTATGRGSIKNLEPSMNALTTVFFSPRLIASRLQFFNPGRYVKAGPVGMKQDPFVLAQNRKAARNLVGGIGLTLALAKMAGAEVETDDRSADFGKIKVGNTRIDITGGHQGYVVNAARQIRAETKSSTTGKVTKLEGGFGKRSAAAVEWDFFKNKLAPTARYIVGQREGQNFDREPFDPVKEAYRSLIPIGVGGTADAYKQEGPALAALTAGLGGIGFGVITYGGDDKPSKSKRRSSKSLRSGGGKRSRSLRR